MTMVQIPRLNVHELAKLIFFCGISFYGLFITLVFRPGCVVYRTAVLKSNGAQFQNW